MAREDEVLCPSARCKPGAVLLGVVQGDGTVAFLPPGFTVDEDFARIAREGRNPESRFRFGDRCVEAACKQWSGSEHRCTIPQQVRARLSPPEDGAVPDCAIRAQCRWHRQDGLAACSLCPLVITDVFPLEEGPAQASLAEMIGGPSPP
jgi:hypothetical protein